MKILLFLLWYVLFYAGLRLMIDFSGSFGDMGFWQYTLIISPVIIWCMWTWFLLNKQPPPLKENRCMTKKADLFGGDNAEEYNALFQAILDCGDTKKGGVYDFLKNTPKTSLTAELVDKLHENGFSIIPTPKGE